MKTLLLSEVFPPQHGGSGRWLYELYRRFDPAHVRAAVAKHDQAEGVDASTDMPIHRIDWPIRNWGLTGWNTLQSHRKVYQQLARIIDEHHIDTIHAGRTLSEGLLAAGLCWRRGMDFTVYVHGEELNTFAASRELRFLARRTFARARTIIANSRNTAALLKPWLTDHEKIVIHHPGVDTQHFTPTTYDPQTRERLGWSNRPVLLTVSRLQQRKGHDRMIEALQQLRKLHPNVLWAVAGDGPMREILHQKVREAKLGRHVQWLGAIDDATMRDCYQQCDLFVLPARPVEGDIEGFGMVLIEAQACGKPVIAGQCGGTGETLIHGKTGWLIDARQPQHIHHACDTLLRDPARRIAMGRAARQWVCDNFCFDQLARQLHQQFNIPLADFRTIRQAA